jgi:hypothetical protein
MGQDDEEYCLCQDVRISEDQPPITVLIRIRKDGLMQMIRRANENKGHRAVDGPVTVQVKPSVNADGKLTK